MTRQYNNQQIRVERYQQAEQAGEAIDTLWMLDAGLSTNREAARKMLNRDCHAGILKSKPTRVRSYRLIQNVTLHSVPPLQSIAGNMGGQASTILSTNEGQILLSPPKLQPLSCNANDVTINQNTERSRRYRARTKAGAGCSCVYGSSVVCDYCSYTKVQFTTANRASGSILQPYKLHGELGKRLGPVDWRIFRAFDSVLDAPCFYSHNVALMLNIPAREARKDVLDIHGVNVTCFLSKNGKLEIQSRLTESPLDYPALVSFAKEIQAALPYETPPVETWDIRCSDINFQGIDVTGQSWVRYFKSITFPYHSSTFHAYLKPINRRTILRIELTKEQPNTTLADYPQYLKRAGQKLLSAMC